jgi:hypothetical protein
LIIWQQRSREDAGVVALPAIFARMYQPANTATRTAPQQPAPGWIAEYASGAAPRRIHQDVA